MSAVLAPAAAQRGDRRLAVAGVLAIAVAAGTAVARRLGVVPEGWAVAAILAIGSVSLGVVVRFIGTRASAEHRARVATRIASVGLALSTTAVALLLPGLTEDAGWATFAADVGTFYTGWIEPSHQFHARYLDEQLRKAALLPQTSSEVERLS